MKKINGYDIYFTLNSPACFLCAGKSKKDVKEKAEEILMNMEKEELIDRLLAAVDFNGLKISYIEKVDELTEEDIK